MALTWDEIIKAWRSEAEKAASKAANTEDKKVLKKRLKAAIRALCKVGCDHWHSSCQKAVKRIGRIK